MTVDPWRPGRATSLTDRHAERDILGRLVDAIRASESRVLVLRGDPGVGKTALLDHLAEQAHECRVARAVGGRCWTRRWPGRWTRGSAT